MRTLSPNRKESWSILKLKFEEESISKIAEKVAAGYNDFIDSANDTIEKQDAFQVAKVQTLVVFLFNRYYSVALSRQ